MRSLRLVTTDDWPEAELRAAMLAGELVPVGSCWASPAEPQDPALRAAAFAWAVPTRKVVASGRTAAWIWGGLSRPPDPVEVSIRPQLRVHVEHGVRLREVQLPASDVVTFAGSRTGTASGVAVTAPVRTVVDLLRAPGPRAGTFGADEALAVGGLFGAGVVDPAEVAARLTALGTIPMARQAERRLRDLLRASVVVS
ncbi:type IV toxin-antitoxin system AbiEi family antitoxin [Curtobacterium sp. ISL-83]|uniref:type IV toxin-antitoxin system AbiEi family antitoxin n=1 Tax=Curtobacterium sp. ISL-83 TaxID=2819145 RepID=UPI001BE95A16|nr:type IV toxin-antitoxin system AbiEi family antitoxin [Curtobacterium sp. ISL-83]MBT2501167.1 hypothetical protein [Curtobacterium sp. ISL-83]